MKDNISASFTWTEQDYAAVYRAARMVQHPGYDSFVMRAGFLVFAHLFFFIGFLIVGAAIAGAEGENGPIPPAIVAMVIAFSLASAYALFTRWYGFRWMMRRAFLSSLLYDLKVNYLFTPQHVESTNRLAQSKRVWILIDQVVEFRDGFMLISSESSQDWIPKYAFTEPFDEMTFSEFARSGVKHYRFINRAAALSK